MRMRWMMRGTVVGVFGVICAATVVGPVVGQVSSGPATTRAAAVAADKPDPRRGNNGQVNQTLMARHERLVAKAKAGNIDLYMLGDSITDNWQNGSAKVNWEANLGGWRPGDFGIGGDKTENVLFRIENGELDGVKPKVIVLMIGTNNLSGGTSPEETLRGVKAIVADLEAKQPAAKKLLLAIFPRAATAADPLRKKVEATNVLLAQENWPASVKFMNINAKFLDAEGNLSKEIFPDLLHPNPKGYQIWADAMRPTLVEWLGEPAATAPATGR